MKGRQRRGRFPRRTLPLRAFIPCPVLVAVMDFRGQQSNPFGQQIFLPQYGGVPGVPVGEAPCPPLPVPRHRAWNLSRPSSLCPPPRAARRSTSALERERIPGGGNASECKWHGTPKGCEGPAALGDDVCLGWVRSPAPFVRSFVRPLNVLDPRPSPRGGPCFERRSFRTPRAG